MYFAATHTHAHTHTHTHTHVSLLMAHTIWPSHKCLSPGLFCKAVTAWPAAAKSCWSCNAFKPPEINRNKTMRCINGRKQKQTHSSDQPQQREYFQADTEYFHKCPPNNSTSDFSWFYDSDKPNDPCQATRCFWFRVQTSQKVQYPETFKLKFVYFTSFPSTIPLTDVPSLHMYHQQHAPLAW